MVADSTENYLGFETDLQDLELGYLLQRADRRLEVGRLVDFLLAAVSEHEVSLPYCIRECMSRR